jgi:hypothetical protein
MEVPLIFSFWFMVAAYGAVDKFGECAGDGVVHVAGAGAGEAAGYADRSLQLWYGPLRNGHGFLPFTGESTGAVFEASCTRKQGGQCG